MNLAYAILADNAEIQLDGKFMLFGAGIEVLHAPAFPAMVPALSLIIKLNVEVVECDSEHELRVELLDPSGSDIVASAAPVKFIPHAPLPRFDLPPRYLFVLGFPGLVVTAAGRYEFRLLVDNAEVGVVPLYFAQTPPSGQALGEASEA